LREAAFILWISDCSMRDLERFPTRYGPASASRSSVVIAASEI